MVKTLEQALRIQARRVKSGKKGISKAVRRYLMRQYLSQEEYDYHREQRRGFRTLNKTLVGRGQDPMPSMRLIASETYHKERNKFHYIVIAAQTISEKKE
jgi:hypothetical protein